ncbi:MAG: ABC transporter permease [Candidatus Cohnella colombiensis]|uniref:ABC transporter permease n=1 Tax=Candidatus Cohnella colombiensis TaxID=3121368 RepID=A0AA95ET52_9BACL|nr:MAG: ABC transporter permease [Cohnella sp.]
MRIRALVLRIAKQFIKDKRTLALMLLAPLLVLTLMKFVFDGQTVAPRIAVVNAPEAFVSALQHSGAAVSVYSDMDEPERLIQNAELDAIVTIDNLKPRIILEGSSPSKSSNAMEAIQQALKQLLNSSLIQPEITFLHGQGEFSAFDYFGSVLVGFLSFFFVFLIAGVSFLRERTTGTLQRLLATPLRRTEIVIGYLVGFGIFTLLQASLIVWYSTSVLGIALEGSFVLILLMNLVLAVTALTLGTLLSAFAQNEFQMIQFIPIVIIPQVFFCGLIELDSLPEWLQYVGKILPLTYGAEALRSIMLQGAGWSEVWNDFLILIGFAIVFAVLNVRALRKHRRI